MAESAEAVALALFELIAEAESKAIRSYPSGSITRPDRKWILDAYAECLLTVKAPEDRG